MNPPIRRLLALAGSVVAGLFGAIVLVSPAQAHHPLVSGTADCLADGQYKITWTVTNGNWNNPYMKVKEYKLTPADTTVTGILTGDSAPFIDPDKSVTGIQYVPGTTKQATLKIYGIWFHKKTDQRPSVQNNEDKYKGVVKLEGTCKAEDSPTATFTDRCDGTINVHLVNPTSTMKSFRIKGTGGFDETVEVDAKTEADKAVAAGAGALTVTVKIDRSWNEIGKHEAWARPDECPPPTVLSWSTCDNFKIAVTNSEKGQPVDAKATYGSQTQSKTVAPGKTENFEFSPSSTTTATVELAGWETQTVTYTKPANCDELPKTGSATTTYIASGTGLAMLGGLAFLFARRRMVKLRKLADS